MTVGGVMAGVVARERGSRRRRPRLHGGAIAALPFVLPAVAAYGVFLVWPAARSVVISFTNWNGIAPASSWVGLKNYAEILSDPTAQTAIQNNILWTVVTVAIPTLLGLLLAVVLDSKIKATSFLRTVFYMPAVMPLVGVATIWSWLYDPSNGAVNAVLRDTGLGFLAHSWLGTNSTALGAAMVPAIWVQAGFPLLIYLAALQGISSELKESARTDGANKWQVFWHVTMPGLRSAHYIVIALTVVNSFKVFDIIFAMTFGGPGNSTQVLGTWMYFNVFQYHQAGYGTAIAVVITIVAIICGIPYVIAQMRESER